MAYPGNRRNIVHPHDVSLMTCGQSLGLLSLQPAAAAQHEACIACAQPQTARYLLTF